jgi:hypothetical protein
MRASAPSIVGSPPAAAANADVASAGAAPREVPLVETGPAPGRSTMCRLQLTQPGMPDGSRQPFSMLRDSVGLEPRWMMVVPGPGGSMRSVAYLWRDGFAPQPLSGQTHETN